AGVGPLYLDQLWGGISGFVIGIGLSAACGFRVILPFLGLSLAAFYGFVEPSPGFQWMGTWPAVVAFATAAVLEIGAYYVPWMDNLLDAAATPLAVAAGTIITASLMTDVSPFIKWSLALIAGGGVAGTVQASTALLRGVSTLSTGGTANILLATAEVLASTLTTFLALLLPPLAFLLAASLIVWGFLRLRRRRNG
ncbi:MAG TPA: DUF4126 domain-containing protein, partial [Syntrophales bacterium]|nr:DUF4126 domain-containing protein [Syntrophales bacterium]HOM06912.1 DUF4126 domain-containing protein [Syntrophales bacterium]